MNCVWWWIYMVINKDHTDVGRQRGDDGYWYNKIQNISEEKLIIKIMRELKFIKQTTTSYPGWANNRLESWYNARISGRRIGFVPVHLYTTNRRWKLSLITSRLYNKIAAKPCVISIIHKTAAMCMYKIYKLYKI
jgi:hypothetical protein